MLKHVKNEKGFSVAEGILIMLLAAVVGLAGWYVYQNQNKDESTDSSASQTTKTEKEETKEDDETAGWKQVESIGGAFTVKIPDGWELNSYPGNTMNGDSITYSADKAAVITEGGSVYAGDQKKINITFSSGEPYNAPQWQSPNQYGEESVVDFVAGKLSGKRYKIEWTQSVTGVNKGDKIYQYVFRTDNGDQLSIVYMQGVADANNLQTVDKMVKTLVVKE